MTAMETIASVATIARPTATETIASVATIARPQPVPVTTVPLDDNERIAYQRLASTIGFRPADLLYAHLLAFLKASGIAIYDDAQVVAYLDRESAKYGPSGSWWWRPLRQADVMTAWGWGQEEGTYHREHGASPGTDRYVRHARNIYRHTLWSCRPYGRAVPLRVLSHVEQITSEFGEELKFFVTELGPWTDPIVPRADPFIAAVALDMPRVIFDMWDEPGFAG